MTGPCAFRECGDALWRAERAGVLLSAWWRAGGRWRGCQTLMLGGRLRENTQSDFRLHSSVIFMIIKGYYNS